MHNPEVYWNRYCFASRSGDLAEPIRTLLGRLLSSERVGPETPGAWLGAKGEAILKLVPGMNHSGQRGKCPTPYACVGDHLRVTTPDP